MKIRVIDRIMLGAAGLVCTLAAGFAIVDCIQGFKMTGKLNEMLAAGGQTAAIIAAACMVLVLGVGLCALVLAVMSRKAPDFVLQHTENGELNIKVSAIDELVRKCVATHREIVLTDTAITNGKEGLTIGLQLSLASGVSIPLAVASLQKQMKQFITTSTGLDVKEVCVQVDTAEVKDLQATDFVMPDMLGVTEAEEHTEVPALLGTEAARNGEEPLKCQRMFGADESLAVVPAPPAAPAEAEAQADTAQEQQEETEPAQPEAEDDRLRSDADATAEAEEEDAMQDVNVDAVRPQIPVKEVQV